MGHSFVLWELILHDEPYDGACGPDLARAVAREGQRPKLPRFAPDEYLALTGGQARVHIHIKASCSLHEQLVGIR
jgi:hypothetical protein